MDEEQLQFWQEPVSLAEEIAPEERRQLSVSESTTADEGNGWAPRHHDDDGGIEAVVDAAPDAGMCLLLLLLATVTAGPRGNLAVGRANVS